MKTLTTSTLLSLALLSGIASAQKAPAKANDSTTPLHALQPDYIVPYGNPGVDNVTKVLNRVYTYLDAVTPTEIIDKPLPIRAALTRMQC